ncbi:MAG: FxsA family protein [Pseudomonadota bacterium]
MRLFLLLVAIPIIEIALFIEVGGWIGTWPMVGIVILTAIVGSAMLRQQGLGVLHSMQERLAGGENPGRLLADGAMILFAGALLLTPGFFTDAVGFLLLLPPVRTAVWNWAAPRFKTVHVQTGFTMGAGGPRRPMGPDGQTVDGTYEEVHPGSGPGPDQSDDDTPPNGPGPALPPRRS